MKYNFDEIEAKWQNYWANRQTFKAEQHSGKPKYYALDMFPYPSGAGLHVGHPLGYIASDVYARYKRLRGYNVLHPMGYDSFGLPAEQYAIQTGQHPAITTEANINRYRKQLDNLGFSFDWSREVRTSDPDYYRWTQWIFIQLFNSWYNKDADKAEAISTLIAAFEVNGNATINAAADDDVPVFTAADWKTFSPEAQQRLLLKYRLTYLAEAEVNWCPALGTVLANDEVIHGVSERGGHPVVRKKMTQWSMRITAYAERLLQGLETIDWPEPLKEMQRHWIGKSVGAEVQFRIQNSEIRTQNSILSISVFTTRPDTIFGASFMVLAPEHELVSKIVTDAQKKEVEAYIEATAKRSERDRMADVKTISGVFTGAYALHPFTQEKIPVWLGDYVLAGYGTGAVMAVPCGDQRDYDFAKHFNLPIPNIFEGVDTNNGAFADKEHTRIANSGFLNGLNYEEATQKVIAELERAGKGQGKTNYRMRDAVYSRQRYWGEPIPMYYHNGIPYPLPEACLPLTLPQVDHYLPTEIGDPPLGNARVWAWDTQRLAVTDKQHIDSHTVFPLELNTMPGWAGSSWYFNRYMDPKNKNEFTGAAALSYWKEVDLYIGGSEHATGHLLYARFWQHFLFDRGWVPVKEFAKKLINQGMILGESAFLAYTQLMPLPSRFPESLLNMNIDKMLKAFPIAISDNIFRKNINEPFIDSFKEVIDEIVDKIATHYNVSELKEFGFEINCFDALQTRVLADYVNSSNALDIPKFKEWHQKFKDAIFIGEDGKIITETDSSSEKSKGVFIVAREPEKMSKSKYNVVNPDDICTQYGADTLRLYEMFLGPLEQSKPWNTAGITGVHGFLKKLWKLYVDTDGLRVMDTPPTKEQLKTLHKTIKKVQEDIEHFSFNTPVAAFMICVNELTVQQCASRAVLEPLLVILSPYAPHIAEELWERLGHRESIAYEPFPEFDPDYLTESSKEYPVSFNGKVRFKITLPLDHTADAIEKAVMTYEKTQQQLQGNVPKKVIIVPGKIINIVL